MSDFEPGMPPPPFEHRDSVQDLIDFEEAQCSGGERKLFVRWMEEDSAKVAKAREKKSAADEKAASAEPSPPMPPRRLRRRKANSYQ